MGETAKDSRQAPIWGLFLIPTFAVLTAALPYFFNIEIGPARAHVSAVSLLFNLALFYLLKIRTGASVRQSIIFFALNGVLTIIAFAGIYRSLGIIEQGFFRYPTHMDAAYFSIVTFTTLGYGDFQPVAAYRMVAAIEALIGYVYLGLLVGFLLQLRDEGKSG